MNDLNLPVMQGKHQHVSAVLGQAIVKSGQMDVLLLDQLAGSVSMSRN